MKNYKFIYNNNSMITSQSVLDKVNEYVVELKINIEGFSFYIYIFIDKWDRNNIKKDILYHFYKKTKHGDKTYINVYKTKDTKLIDVLYDNIIIDDFVEKNYIESINFPNSLNSCHAKNTLWCDSCPLKNNIWCINPNIDFLDTNIEYGKTPFNVSNNVNKSIIKHIHNYLYNISLSKEKRDYYISNILSYPELKKKIQENPIKEYDWKLETITSTYSNYTFKYIVYAFMIYLKNKEFFDSLYLKTNKENMDYRKHLTKLNKEFCKNCWLKTIYPTGCVIHKKYCGFIQNNLTDKADYPSNLLKALEIVYNKNKKEIETISNNLINYYIDVDTKFYYDTKRQYKLNYVYYDNKSNLLMCRITDKYNSKNTKDIPLSLLKVTNSNKIPLVPDKKPSLNLYEKVYLYLFFQDWRTKYIHIEKEKGVLTLNIFAPDLTKDAFYDVVDISIKNNLIDLTDIKNTYKVYMLKGALRNISFDISKEE